MARIFVIKNLDALRLTPGIFIVPSWEGLDKLTARGVLEPIVYEDYTDSDRAVFIRDYIEFIASLNKLYQDRLLWWVTDISSKNRCINPLSDLLQELWEIRQALVKYSDQNILIVGPSPAIEDSLRFLLEKSGKKFYWYLSAWRAAFERMSGMIKKVAGIFYHSFRIYQRMLIAKIRLEKKARRVLAKTGPFYVIKTFSFDTSWDSKGRFQDVFFGRLAELVPKDRNVLTVTLHEGNISRLLDKSIEDPTGIVFPIEYFLTAKDIFGSAIDLLLSKLPVKGKMLFRDVDVTGIIRHEFTRTFNGGVSPIQYLHYHASRNLLCKIYVEIFLISFENNPWERMCTMAVQRSGGRTKLIGYEHAVISEGALSMFISPSEKDLVPLPHRVIMPGKIPLDFMKKYGDYSTVDLVAGCALRYENIFQAGVNPWKRGRHILVVLDGVPKTKGLLEYIYRESEKLREWQFVLRPHPELPWHFLSADYNRQLGRRPHVAVSQSSLEEDLDKADVVVYWQSTVALEALNRGKPLIHFAQGMILSFDPLYGFSSLKWTVRSSDTLGEVLDKIYALSDREYEAQYKAAKTFIAEYFYPVSASRLQVFWEQIK